jgi:sarcosine oxidase
MKVIVIGAGAWGLPAAAQLAARAHEVTLVDRYGPGNVRSSSSGLTRLWRVIHADEMRVRLGILSIEAMKRVQRRSGRTVFLRTGLLWRDVESLPAAALALDACVVPITAVDADDVGRFFPGLVADGRDAIWQEDGGVLLAAAMLAAQLELFTAAGGQTQFGRSVRSVEATTPGIRVSYGDGEVAHFDRAVLAAGPESQVLLRTLGLEVELRPVLEQVVTVGDFTNPGLADHLPCFIDGATGTDPGMYAMPTPGLGYKIGLDQPLRPYQPEDADRQPDDRGIEATVARVRRDLQGLPHQVVHAQVCSWTDSPDGRFVLDRHGDDVVIACGDSGEGFKFSALVGEILADLVEHRNPQVDIEPFALTRFRGANDWTSHSLTGG